METKAERYLITYTQEFAGETTTGTFTKHVDNEQELKNIRSNLFRDPHILSVEIGKEDN